jgi:hypothetical protein
MCVRVCVAAWVLPCTLMRRRYPKAKQTLAERREFLVDCLQLHAFYTNRYDCDVISNHLRESENSGIACRACVDGFRVSCFVIASFAQRQPIVSLDASRLTHCALSPVVFTNCSSFEDTPTNSHAQRLSKSEKLRNVLERRLQLACFRPADTSNCRKINTTTRRIHRQAVQSTKTSLQFLRGTPFSSAPQAKQIF